MSLKGKSNILLGFSTVLIWILPLVSFSSKPINDFHKEFDISVSRFPEILLLALNYSQKMDVLIADEHSENFCFDSPPFNFFSRIGKYFHLLIPINLKDQIFTLFE